MLTVLKRDYKWGYYNPYQGLLVYGGTSKDSTHKSLITLNPYAKVTLFGGSLLRGFYLSLGYQRATHVLGSTHSFAALARSPQFRLLAPPRFQSWRISSLESFFKVIYVLRGSSFASRPLGRRILEGARCYPTIGGGGGGCKHGLQSGGMLLRIIVLLLHVEK